MTTAFQDKVVIVTGGAKGIGAEIVRQFKAAGATVAVIDKLPNDYFVGDISDKAVLDRFVAQVLADFGRVDILVNNALPVTVGVSQGTYADFTHALQVGVTAPFYLSQQLLPYFNPGASIINITSSRSRMSQAETESYTAAKGALAALTHALAISLARRVRVNAIAPGWIDTTAGQFSEADKAQHPVGRVGEPADIANLVLYLCSEQASFITGQEFLVDGGMSKQMIYHDDYGWTYQPQE